MCLTWKMKIRSKKYCEIRGWNARVPISKIVDFFMTPKNLIAMCAIC